MKCEPELVRDRVGEYKRLLMAKATDIRVVGASLYFLPVKMRVPLKFGPETSTEVQCARVRMTVENSAGKTASGWGETPLSVVWVWPSTLSFQEREETLKKTTQVLTEIWPQWERHGHPMEVGHAFQKEKLPEALAEINRQRAGKEPMPWLAALVCNSAFDLALHDAYGRLVNRPVYETYSSEYMNFDLAQFLEPAAESDARFEGLFPDAFVRKSPLCSRLKAWHLVGGLDPLNERELTGSEPNDGYPVLLKDWIRRDGLKCLKIKLRGNDAAWDFDRLIRVGTIAVEEEVEWLTADFNCTVEDPDYVNEILDKLKDGYGRLYGMLLYVEQPFPYDLEQHREDVHSVSARKPLFLDESAHDWKLVRLGRSLGWTGVALKTCKTQTGAVLAACWAKAHGMTLMVQDLTNPMLAQISHVQLAAHVGTIMGVETNAMQFYPEASRPEAEVHPGLYRRCEGCVDLSTIRGPGFGYREEEIKRELPAETISAGCD